MAMDILKDDDNITSMISMKFANNHIQQCNVMMQHDSLPRNRQNLVTTYWKNNLPMLAQVFNDNVLRIQHEFTTINEIEKPFQISFITFSLCGNNIIFASKEGVVIEYQYKRQGAYNILARLGESVDYLQCIELDSPNDHSVVSYNSSDSHNGAIVVITGGVTKIHILSDAGCIKKFSWEFAVFLVFPMGHRQLLCIDVSGGIFVIHMDKKSGDTELVTYPNWRKKVSHAAFCPKKLLVAVTYTGEANTKFLEITDLTERKPVFNKHLSQFTPTCCAFSFAGDLLALGSNDGRITIFNLSKNLESILHASDFPVEFVKFSKSVLPILAVVGREVSWWNLESFGTGRKNDSIGYTQFDREFWENKTVHQDVSNLLQTVSLYSKAVHFSVSENFETYLVVDDESRIYVIKCIK